MFSGLVRTIFGVLWLSGFAQAEETTEANWARQVLALPWQTEVQGDIAGLASIDVPSGYRFLNAEATSRFLELNGNPPALNNYTFATENISWFAVFEFDPSGYVRDDESIDSDALLKILKEDNKRQMEERRRLNLPGLVLEDWSVPPHYDATTHRLEWGTKLREDSGDITVNYSIKLLGRGGVMNAILVTYPEALATDVAEFKKALATYSFVPGQRYSEFRSGDKVAAYGLTALIVGGAAAAAAKSGLFKVFGKFIAIGAIGLLVAILGLFRRLFRRPSS